MKLHKIVLFAMFLSSVCVAQQQKNLDKTNNSKSKNNKNMILQKINIADEFASMKPMKLKTLTTINNHSVKVINLVGDYKMHHHNSEKLFMVIEGTLFLEFKDRPKMEIKKGEMVTIPSGLDNKPSSPEGVSLLFFEK